MYSVAFFVVAIAFENWALLAVRRARKNSHEHRWISVSSNDGYFHTDANGLLNKGRPKTMILQRCACGDVTTAAIEGKWSPMDLGINDDTVRDLTLLLNEIKPNKDAT